MGVFSVSFRPVLLAALPFVWLTATAADGPMIIALNQLQPGKWMLTSRDAAFVPRAICLGDPRLLLQLRQPVVDCTRVVIANDPTSATVNYSCRGTGSGRTTVRVETPRLVQVDTQGISGGAPFDMTIEARRTGDCASLSMR